MSLCSLFLPRAPDHTGSLWRRPFSLHGTAVSENSLTVYVVLKINGRYTFCSNGSCLSWPHCFRYCSFLVSLEIRLCESSNFAPFQDNFGYSGYISFPYNFRISFSISTHKETCLNFYWNGIEYIVTRLFNS